MINPIYSPAPERYDNGMKFRRCGQSGILLPARCTVGPRPVRSSILTTVIDDTVEGSYIVAQPHKTHHEDQ